MEGLLALRNEDVALCMMPTIDVSTVPQIFCHAGKCQSQVFIYLCPRQGEHCTCDSVSVQALSLGTKMSLKEPLCEQLHFLLEHDARNTERHVQVFQRKTLSH